MHNHARLWTAMLATNIAKADWYTMSRWMYYYLLDGDLASNTLSWQWVAGTLIQKRYLVPQASINLFAQPAEQGTFLDVDESTLPHLSLPTSLAASQPFTFRTEYGPSDHIESVAGKTVCLYSPWTIDPLWRRDLVAERIFVIEPSVFDEFPVSHQVYEHMLSFVRTHLPDAQVYVGNIETIPGIDQATVFMKDHPAFKYPQATRDPIERLFPHVTGYHQSFFKFWQACQGTV